MTIIIKDPVYSISMEKQAYAANVLSSNGKFDLV